MKRKIYLLLLFLGAVIVEGCTDLTEEVLDENLTTKLTEEQAADAVIVPVYGQMFDLFIHTRYFAIQEISTDEAILPYRGGTDWGDNGIYIALHQHLSNSTDPNLRDTWNGITRGLSRTVAAINQLPELETAKAKTYLAEAHAMYGYYSMLTLDLFGIVFVKEDVNSTSTILRGNEAVEYIKSQFLLAEPDLTTDVGPGRITKAAVWGMLARLHLNAAVYNDRYAENFNFR